MGIPLVTGDGASATFSCPHGGQFAVSASCKAKEGSKNVACMGDSITPVTPCPGVPNAGIPPCQYPSGMVGTSALVLCNGKPAVKMTDQQISATNGTPALPPTSVTSKKFTSG